MKPICIQRYIKRKMRFSLRYKLNDLYDMYLDKADAYERIHKEKVIPIKIDTLRRNISHWDWIAIKGQPGSTYYVRIDEPKEIEFTDIYEAVMRRYRGIFNGKGSNR